MFGTILTLRADVIALAELIDEVEPGGRLDLLNGPDDADGPRAVGDVEGRQPINARPAGSLAHEWSFGNQRSNELDLVGLQQPPR